MNINTRNMSFINYNRQEMQWVKFNGVTVYEAWRNLIASGVPPLTLTKCKGVDLVNYKLYGNSIQDGEPTPEAPIEVESVGDKTNNLIPYPWYETSKTQNGVTFTDNGDGTLTLNGTASATTVFYFSYQKPIIKPNVTYSFYGMDGGSGTTFEMRVTDTLTTAHSSRNNEPKTFSYEDTSKFSVMLYIRAGSVFNDFVVTPMLEEGTTATGFERYGYRIPIKVRNKNLITGQMLIEHGFVLQDDGSYYVSRSNTPYKKILYKNTQQIQGSMTLSFYSKFVLYNNTGGCFPMIYYTDGTRYSFGGYLNTEYQKLKYTTPSNKTIDYISWMYATGTAETYIKDMQLEIGTETEYEEGIEPITTNIYLNEPLRKIGDYADYIDFKNQKVIRNIIKVDLKDYTWQSNNGNPAIYYVQDIKDFPSQTTGKTDILCNVLVGQAIGSSNSNIGIQVYNNGVIRARPDLTVFDTVAKWQEYITNNESYCLFQTTETEETIQLPNIPTIKGTTIIGIETTTQPSNLEVVYIGK